MLTADIEVVEGEKALTQMVIIHVAPSLDEMRLQEEALNLFCEGRGECPEESLIKKGIRR